MSSRFATERVVLAQDDLVDPSQREASGCSWNGRMARRQRRTLPRPRCRRTCHGASSFGESSSRWRTERCTRTPRRAWAGSLRGPLLPRLEPPCVHGAGLLRFIVAERSRAFPPRPEKLPTRKASHRHDGADGNPPGAALPDSFITVRLAVGARPGHMVTRCPCVTDRDRWTAWCTCP